jgi:hypothetical protein
MKSIYIRVDLSYHVDIFYAIDYNKSIKKKRLVYKTGYSIVFEYIWYWLIILFSAGVVTLPAIVKPANVSHISIYYILFCIVFDFWLMLNVFFLNAFVEIQGQQKDLNKEDIINTLSEFYNLKNLNTSGNKIIRYVRLTGFFHGGRVVSVLLKDDIIYLNITTLLRYDGLSCFNGLYNYYKCRRIANRFKELQTIRNIPSDNQ